MLPTKYLQRISDVGANMIDNVKIGASLCDWTCLWLWTSLRRITRAVAPASAFIRTMWAQALRLILDARSQIVDRGI